MLIVSWEYPPVVEGGLARHVHKLSEQLAALEVEVHVLTRGERRHTEQRDDGVLVHRVAEPMRPQDLERFVAWVEGMNADMLAAGSQLVEEVSFDIVHSHDWLVARAGRHLARTSGCPWIVTVHATEHGRHQGWVKDHPQSYIHGVERWMTRSADGVITCSEFMREHCAEVFGVARGKVNVIPNGIDGGDLRPRADLDELRARFARPDEKLVLLAGRLVYEKGFQFALEALRKVSRRHRDVRFVVAGSGTHEQELKALSRRLGLSRRGTFLGWAGDEVLHSLYRVADLCVVPSIYEPFGLVALEAMVSGCPCVVADTGGLREVVPNEEVGLRFRSRDSAALAENIERVLTDERLRARLVAEASEHVLSFDWADVARRTFALYEDLLAATV